MSKLDELYKQKEAQTDILGIEDIKAGGWNKV